GDARGVEGVRAGVEAGGGVLELVAEGLGPERRQPGRVGAVKCDLDVAGHLSSPPARPAGGRANGARRLDRADGRSRARRADLGAGGSRSGRTWFQPSARWTELHEAGLCRVASKTQAAWTDCARDSSNENTTDLALRQLSARRQSLISAQAVARQLGALPAISVTCRVHRPRARPSNPG